MQAGVLSLLLRDLLVHLFEAMADHFDDLLLSFELVSLQEILGIRRQSEFDVSSRASDQIRTSLVSGARSCHLRCNRDACSVGLGECNSFTTFLLPVS
jgi:hypothetical protein